MKYLILCLLFLFMSGCTGMQYVPAQWETQSADIANQLRSVREQLHEFKEAAKTAAEFEEDANTLDVIGNAIDKDMERAHKDAIDLNKKIKDKRDE